MESLNKILPPPVYQVTDARRKPPPSPAAYYNDQVSIITTVATCPPYGKRRNWFPKRLEDFGDGGAFPEIHMPQFPLNMGSKGDKSSSVGNALVKQIDADGKVKYDMIAKQGQRANKVVHSKFKDLTTKIVDYDDPDLRKPDEETIRETSEKTREALMKLVEGRVAAAQPVRMADKKEQATYIRYTPAQQGMAFNSGSKQSIIRMVDVQKDPMEPPRFLLTKKIPQRPPSPPPVVMHSPPRKVSVKEQESWKIPPCISNWKNAKGYTVPLDKRLASNIFNTDTGPLTDKFQQLQDALFLAEKKARQEVEMRASVEKRKAEMEKEAKENKLKALAQNALEERMRAMTEDKQHGRSDGSDEDDPDTRDEIRKDLAREREKGRNTVKGKKTKRERERDITEKIVLGQPGKATNESLFDQRLFNQTKGMDSGFAGGDDEMYNVYDKPWRADKNLSTELYRPTRKTMDDHIGDLEQLSKMDKFESESRAAFKGADAGVVRSGPVQFEKKVVDDDPFGLNTFLDRAKKGQKRGHEEEDGRRHHHHHHREPSTSKTRKF